MAVVQSVLEKPAARLHQPLLQLAAERAGLQRSLRVHSPEGKQQSSAWKWILSQTGEAAGVDYLWCASHFLVISAMAAWELVVYSQKICTALAPRTCIFNPPVAGVNFRCSLPLRTGVMTPSAILVTCGQSRAASTAGIALGITVECRPLNFAPSSSPRTWLTISSSRGFGRGGHHVHGDGRIERRQPFKQQKRARRRARVVEIIEAQRADSIGDWQRQRIRAHPENVLEGDAERFQILLQSLEAEPDVFVAIAENHLQAAQHNLRRVHQGDLRIIRIFRESRRIHELHGGGGR